MLELIDLVSSVTIFLSQMTLLRWLPFLLRSLTVNLTVLLFWIYFSWCYYLLCNGFTPLGNSDLVFVSVSRFSNKLKTRCPVLTIPMLIGTVFPILWEIFHGRVSLNSVLLQMPVNFVNGLRLELIYISLTITIRSNLTHLHGFQLLVLHKSLNLK